MAGARPCSYPTIVLTWEDAMRGARRWPNCTERGASTG